MMDFLDEPKKQRSYTVKLYTAYVLIAVAIGLATTLLFYAANGFGLKQGQVIQNGLIYVSSTPGGSKVLINDKQNGATGERLTLEAGTYTLKIQRDGYRDWQRAVTVEGGLVEHFDYPFLFPSNLVTSTTNTYESVPAFATQSPDRRWLVISKPGSQTDFDLYDLKNAKQVVHTSITLPAGVLTQSAGSKESLQLVEWSTDNRHVLLVHNIGPNSEYVLLDTQHPLQSKNVTKMLHLNENEQLKLQNKAYDHYFVFNPKAQTLSTASQNNTTPALMIDHVLAYKTYGTNIILYATGKNAPGGLVNVMLHQNNKNYLLRTLPAKNSYLLNLTQYNGSWFVACGAQGENRVYVYKDPLDQLNQSPADGLVPITALQVDKPDYLEFSANAQYIMAESANRFAVYDAQYDKTYGYSIDAPLDMPQPHATWMDGNRIDYVSDGKLVVFDYDSTNLQTLMTASPNYLPFFDTNYHFVYAITPPDSKSKAPSQTLLTNTALLTSADQ